MLFWIIQVSIISITFILLVHHLLMFFKSTLTVPKIKDLVNLPNQKYQNIFNTISDNNMSDTTNINNLYTDIDLLPTNTNSMKDELKMFLKKQLNNNDGIGTFSSMSTQFSNFE